MKCPGCGIKYDTCPAGVSPASIPYCKVCEARQAVIVTAAEVVEKWREILDEGENVGEYLYYDLEELDKSLQKLNSL